MTSTPPKSPALTTQQIQLASSSTSKEDAISQDTEQLFRTRYFWLPFVFSAFLFTGLDETLQVTSTAQIGAEFHTLDQLAWLGTGAFAGVVAGDMIFPTVGELYGRKTAILTSILAFFVGLLMGSFTHSFDLLVVGRAFQGLGAGGSLTLLSIVIADTFVDKSQRAVWEGLVSAIFGITSTAGPIIGGAIAGTIGWRWIYRIQLPGIFSSLLGITLFFPNGLKAHEKEGVTTWQRLKEYNLWGTVALIAATALLYVGLDHGSNISWRDPTAYATIAAGGISFAVLIVTEWYHPNPIFPHMVLKNRSLLMVLVLDFFVMCSNYLAMYYVPLYYQAVRSSSTVEAGVYMIPGAAVTFVTTIVVSRWISYTGNFKGLTIFSVVVAIAGGLAFALVSKFASFSLAGEMVAYTFWMAGSDAILLGATVALNAHIPIGIDTSPSFRAMYVIRGSGSGFGLAITSCIVQTYLAKMLSGVQPSLNKDTIHNLRQSLTYIGGLTEGQQKDVRAIYGKAVSNAMFFGVAALVICLPAAMLVVGKNWKETDEKDEESGVEESVGIANDGKEGEKTGDS